MAQMKINKKFRSEDDMPCDCCCLWKRRNNVPRCVHFPTLSTTTRHLCTLYTYTWYIILDIYIWNFITISKSALDNLGKNDSRPTILAFGIVRHCLECSTACLSASIDYTQKAGAEHNSIRQCSFRDGFHCLGCRNGKLSFFILTYLNSTTASPLPRETVHCWWSVGNYDCLLLLYFNLDVWR